MIVLDVLGVRVEMPTSQPIVLLRERDGSRYVPIWIGAAEATSIAYAQEGVEPPRPLTHDLLVDVVEAVGRKVASVEIVRLDEGVFYANLVLDDGTRVDARSSDAIAVALRCGADILATEALVDAAGVESSAEEDEVEKFKEFLEEISPEDFEVGDDPGTATDS
ncbi:bifunctional nuclease family protein [Janibacter sp. YIM B02568]|uniref:bifunctional nuclease family protein n=1 Tax=Janibacter endophyticus TaxID=2806261 RepID=UPI001950484E|nr:bifunctional nuclease family protein [Janibacter endophyticus]MBM6546354.1 bifunctional nuclease family protein [Janibacter endophyticus]